MTSNMIELQRTVMQYKPLARVLAITSGKGGVGKTNITANLAICMAALGKKIILFDGDLSLGNLDVITDLDHKYNISHIITGRKSIEEIICPGPAGLQIICASSGLEQLANLNEFQSRRLLAELSKLQRDSDALIIDTAGGISRSVIGFCLAADHVLVVTTPEATAITDAYAIIKVLVKNEFTGRMSLIVNMAQTITEGKRVYQQIANVASRFLNTKLYCAAVLLRDERLTMAVRQRKPVVLAYPKAQITASLVALAAKLTNSLVNEPARESFFRKVVDWLL